MANNRIGLTPGTLYLVGTPIGNLGDITLRAIETLKSVDLIAAEDTRQTKKLLNHLGIEKPLTSYYEHNKRTKGQQLMEILQSGQNVALVSDAGMPGISDPGTDLVQSCIAQGLPLLVIPGPSALITGLVASGLDTTSFAFLGFFPRVKKEQKNLLKQLVKEQRTLIFYESPYRITSTLEVMLEYLGDRRCCVARELTKIYEDYRRGTISEVLKHYENRQVKGEITLLLEGFREDEQVKNAPSWEKIASMVTELREEGLSLGEASKIAAQEYGLSKREIYNRISNFVEKEHK